MTRLLGFGAFGIYSHVYILSMFNFITVHKTDVKQKICVEYQVQTVLAPTEDVSNVIGVSELFRWKTKSRLLATY